MAAKSSPRPDPDQGDPPSGSGVLAEVTAWFQARIPPGWFTGPVRVEADRDEVVVTGTLPSSVVPAGLDPSEVRTIVQALIINFREQTRIDRVTIATHAEAIMGRKVSWAVECAGYRDVFTNVSAPVMTRLRFAERQVLDTLVDASVARTRSEALAWCVRLVGQHHDDWVRELREAMVHVEEVRSKGPKA